MSTSQQRLCEIFQNFGLPSHFKAKEWREPNYDDFSKMQVAPNALGVLSFELYTHKTKPETFRLHHSRRSPQWFIDALAGLPNASRSPTVGVNFSGDAMEAAQAIERSWTYNRDLDVSHWG